MRKIKLDKIEIEEIKIGLENVKRGKVKTIEQVANEMDIELN